MACRGLRLVASHPDGGGGNNTASYSSPVLPWVCLVAGATNTGMIRPDLLINVESLSGSGADRGWYAANFQAVGRIYVIASYDMNASGVDGVILIPASWSNQAGCCRNAGPGVQLASILNSLWRRIRLFLVLRVHHRWGGGVTLCSDRTRI